MPRLHLRILSDLHFAEPASRIATLSMLRPLLDGPEHLVFNGDSIDTRFVDTDARFAEARDAFLEFIQPDRSRLMLITGNHDPNISAHHHGELDEGRLLFTHGDVLFPSVAPWGWEAPHVIVARNQRLAEIPAHEHAAFETQLAVCKHASFATKHLSPAMEIGGSRMKQLQRLLSRLRRVDKVFTSWLRAPDLAAALASEHRPRCELVIFGHTHFPGIWRRRGRVIINTGAFTPPCGARVVDFEDDRVVVRAVRQRRGEFRVGEVISALQPGRDFSQPFFSADGAKSKLSTVQ